MKRLLALILCLTCWIGVLVSCNSDPVDPVDTTPTPAPSGDDTPDEPVDTTIYTLHLAQYTIVYPKDASDTVKKAAENLKATIDALLANGDSIALISDDQTAKTGYEILIGATNREASKAYYAEGVKAEFAVRNVDQTIVLAGYSDALIEKAVKYFGETYLNEAVESRIKVVENYTGGFEKAFEISAATASNIKVVYQNAELESVAEGVVEKVKSVTDVTLTKSLASTTYNADAYEIMIGSYSFEAIKDIKASLWFDGYIVIVRDNKIVMTATNAEHYEKAVVAMGDLLAANLLKDTKNAVLASGNRAREISVSLFNNVPGASVLPKGVYPAGDGSYTAVFWDLEDDTLFKEYCQNVLDEGFSLYSSTNFDGAGRKNKNSFATYISDTKSIDVEFHLGAKSSSGEGVSGRMYVTVSPREGFTLPRQSAPDYTPVDSTQYPMILTQLGTYEYHPTEHAMCYILRLADGSFIVYDTSYGELNGAPVADEIYAVLKKQAPDPNNIVISAFFISHPHGDHMGGFVQFADKYAADKTITVKQCVFNFSEDSALPSTERTYQSQVYAAVKRFGPKLQLVVPHTGNVLYYPGVKFNVLYTHENILALTEADPDLCYGNTTSVVTQMITDDGSKVVFGADHSAMDTYYAGKPFCESALARWYGSFLESDIVTMFHHGLGGGADDEVYPAIKPTIVLWPGTWFRINGDSSGGNYYSGGVPYKLYEVSYNTYFSDLEPDVWHDTPNANGVHGWFVADDGIQIVTFKDGNVSIQTWDTRADYHNS